MRNFLIFAGLFLISLCLNSQRAYSIERKKEIIQVDSVKLGVDYLKHLLNGKDGWQLTDDELGKDIRGLVHFIEDEKIDTILYNIGKYQDNGEKNYFTRPAEQVADSLDVPGYVSHEELVEQLLRIDREVKTSVVRDEIPVPEQLFENMTQKVRLLEKNEAHLLLSNSLVILPDSLKSFQTIPDSSMISSEELQRMHRLDSIKNDILEQARLAYNNNMLQYYIDSVSDNYRDLYVHEIIGQEQEIKKAEVVEMNHYMLSVYNDSVQTSINSTISDYIDLMAQQAELEPNDFLIYNSDGDSTQMWLQKYARYSKRVYIKNEQNDSLGIRIQNLDKNAVQILIDDGVTFTRFAEKQKKDFRFKEELLPEKGLRKVNKLYNVSTPWILGGDGTVGFSQTYLSNWKKGGKSALSTLTVLKGFANYSVDKKKWENNIEIRNGWLKPGGDKIQKNDDKFRFTSRFGVSAFKKWYYSAELDFETQFFYGYKYPDRDKPISGFMAPSRTLLKFGLDYKPNKNFSLFLSPFTSKTVYVRDTLKIDASKFGIKAGKKRYWEPGLNADLKYKREIATGVSFETKYRMFFNYSAPFTKFDVNWENNFVMRMNDYMNMRVMLHFIYDDNVKFPIYGEIDGERVEIGKEAKWQMKEFITIGFSYKLSKRIYKRERIN